MTRGAQTRAFCCCVNEFLVARQASSPVHMDIMLPGWRVVLIFLPAFLFSHYVVYLDWCCAACSAYVQAQTNSTHVMF